ncbi:MAG: HAD family hydrolase [Firmicutes bacterium]|nr:HAD family hydrolase [Bacillota bacterium]MCL1953203.1 HAD family hydrolase [Bacillota bacterium]
MKYKLFISDFDSTLNYDLGYTVSQRTYNAIQNYVNAGGIFCISTGRFWHSIKPPLAKYGIDLHDTLIGCNNGGTIYKAQTGEVVYSCKANHESALQLIKRAYDQGLEVHLFVDDYFYIDKHTAITEKYELNATNLPMTIVGNLVDFVVKHKCQPYKIGIIWDINKTEQDYKNFKQGLNNLDFTMSLHGGNAMVEVTSIDAGKGNTAVQMAKMLNIPLANTIGIGDGDNDVSLLSMVGLGIAMGNAASQVKAVAKKIADNCDDEGVAKILELATADKL